ncbi:MAG: hypothetical protein ACKN85_08830 [Pirellula sp.]
MTISKLIQAWNKNGQTLEKAGKSLAPILIPTEQVDFRCPFLNTEEDHQDELVVLAGTYKKLLDVLNPCTRLRVETVRRWPELSSTASSDKSIGELLESYSKIFHSGLWQTDVGVKRSAAWSALKEKNPMLADAVDRRVGSGEYHHPGVASFIDTLLELSGGKLDPSKPRQDVPNPWLPGHTWILIALENPRSEGDPPGLLLRLRIEKIPNGCGAIYPHPRLGSNVYVTESFAAGIRNAWTVVKNGDLALTEFDYRWWVTVVEPQGKLSSSDALDLPLSQWLVRSGIDGDSATLAFAMALRSVIKEHTLRKDRATTACFRDTKVKDEDFGLGYVLGQSDPVLFPVGAISNKEQAILLCEQPGVGIEKLVLVDGQKSLYPSRMPVEPKKTFLEAYREFSELENWLSDFAEERAGRWERLVQMGKKPEDHDLA